MNKIYNYLKSYILFITIFLIYLIIISAIYYFELFSYKTISVINFVFMIILFFITGFKISSLERNKGYFKGFIISICIIILFILISLISSKITLSSLIYYLSLILSSITGGIIGVTKK
ncbi:MAG: TIGR04086 family membrane protein [Bacilli bacterium]|nr:TIGR04086 family membrane protein [Bacilli bacterium]